MTAIERENSSVATSAAAVPGAGRRREESARRRQSILEAARRCFGRDGYAGATVALIAEEAGVSNGLLYQFFRNKDHLLEVVLKAPRGTRVQVLELGASKVVGEAAVSTTAGRRTIMLALPRDWYTRLEADGREIEIEIQWPEGRDEPVLFEGATFLFRGADTKTTRG